MLVVLFGIVTGLALGLTGGGGSIFAMPLLLHGTDSSVAQAVTLSSLAVGSASLVGAIRGLRYRLVDLRSALMFAATGILAAPLGVWFGNLLVDAARLFAFGLLLLVIGVLMWRNARLPDARVVRASVFTSDIYPTGPACRYSPEGKLRMTTRCALVLMSSGLAAGVMSGVFGVGGGFLIVPTLRATTGLPMHRAVSTSLLIIALISASTVLTSCAGMVQIDVNLTLSFVSGAIAGLAAGVVIAARLAGPALQRMFSALICLVGSWLLVQNYLGVLDGN